MSDNNKEQPTDQELIDALIEAAMDVQLHRATSEDGLTAQRDLNAAQSVILSAFADLRAEIKKLHLENYILENGEP